MIQVGSIVRIDPNADNPRYRGVIAEVLKIDTAVEGLIVQLCNTDQVVMVAMRHVEILAPEQR